MVAKEEDVLVEGRKVGRIRRRQIVETKRRGWSMKGRRKIGARERGGVSGLKWDANSQA